MPLMPSIIFSNHVFVVVSTTSSEADDVSATPSEFDVGSRASSDDKFISSKSSDIAVP
jgi:hypothetical protein